MWEHAAIFYLYFRKLQKILDHKYKDPFKPCQGNVFLHHTFDLCAVRVMCYGALLGLRKNYHGHANTQL